MTDPTMTKTVALLPCPFCGGEPEMPYFGDRVECRDCQGSVVGVEPWNTRTQTDQQLREEVERLREAAELAKACLGAGFGDHPIEAIRGSNINRAWHYLHDALHTSVPLSPIKEGSK